MATTIEDVEGWKTRGREQGATHVIVVCDTFDHEDYPVFVMADEDINDRRKEYNGVNMQRIMEVIEL